MSDHVSWLLELSVKDGQLDDFRALMKDMVGVTRDNEPGTLNYEWSISDDGATVHIYERYTDSAATMVHLASFGANFAERFLGCVDVTGFDIYGEPSDDVKDAFAQMSPSYFGPWGGFAR